MRESLPWDVDSRNSRRKDPSGIKEVVLVNRAGELVVIGPNELQGEDKVELRFAIASGFKNLTILQQKMPTKQFHFVELSACPSGCLNGGGNVAREVEGGGTKESLVESRARVAESAAIHSAGGTETSGRWGEEWMAGGFEEEAARLAGMVNGDGGGEWMRQAFHRVKPLELKIGNLEGVKRDDIGW